MKNKNLFSRQGNSQLIFAFSLILIISFALFSFAKAWTEPSLTPPGGNVSAPLNVGSAAQTKAGALTVTTLTTSAGKLYLDDATEGDIERVNAIVGYNDLFLKSNSAENAAVYIAGSQLGFYSGGAEKWKIDSTGSLTVGSVPWARLSGVPSGLADGDDVGYNSLAALKTAVSNDFHNLGGVDLTNDQVDSSELDNLCGTDNKILKRISGLWVCADDAGGIGGSGADNYIPRWNGVNALENSAIYQTDAGNVGIGTTGPGAKLQIGDTSPGLLLRTKGRTIDGATQVQFFNDGGDYGSGGLLNLHSYYPTNTNPQSPAALWITNQRTNPLAFRVKSSGETYIAGNVGIGTTGPNAKLAVGGTGSSGDAIAAYADSANSALYAQQSGTGFAGWFGGTGGKVWIESLKDPAGCARVYTDINSGELKCGGAFAETDPQVNALTSGKWCTASADGTVINCSSDAPAGGVASVSNSNGTLTISPTTGAVVASLNLANANTWTAAQTFNANTNFPGSGIWNTVGNVGIGTVSPDTNLVVNGSAGSDVFKINTAGNNFIKMGTWGTGVNERGRMQIYDDGGNVGIQLVGDSNNVSFINAGKVGIGTASPIRKLHLADTSTSFQSFTTDTTGHLGTDGTLVGIQADSSFQIYNYENSYIRFATNNSERVRIDSSGNVGIGTTGPNAKLSVGGTGSSGDAIAAYANSLTSALYAEQANITGYAGYFSGKVNVTGNLQVDNAIKVGNGQIYWDAANDRMVIEVTP